MHNVGPYLGILSDINMGPSRKHLPSVRFFIPEVIRKSRRRHFLAACLIQTLFRCWVECRVYLKRKRQLILAQSIIRMWPKMKQYRRLRAKAIMCQVSSKSKIKT